jgi:vancomycin resistance protein YoaR
MTTITSALARTGSIFQLGQFRRGVLIGFLATLVTATAVLLSVSIAVALTSSGRIMPGVRVAGVDVAGLDRAAAEERLRAALPSLATGELMLTVDGSEVSVPYADLGRGYQLDAMLDSAFAVARSGDVVGDALARLRLLVQPSSVPAMAASDDPGAFDRTLAQLVARFSRDPVDATVTSEQGGSFHVMAAIDGASVDPEALRAALTAALARTDGTPEPVVITTEPVAPLITTAAASKAALQAERMVDAPLAVRTDDSSYTLAAEDLAPLISFRAGSNGRLAPEVDRDGLAALIEPLSSVVAREPADAAFEWGASGITGVTPAKDGLALNVDGSVASVVRALQSRANASVIRSAALSVTVTPAALTTEAAQAAAAKMVRLPGGTWTTYFVPGEGNYWGKNITIPAQDLNGFVVAPGEWFSFWHDIGPVTIEHGYGYGGAIIGGRSVADGALAGGICSTSTTLFNAAMRAGLEIGDRTNHSYYIERYPVGLDATVFQTDYYETDMTFRNDMSTPVVIRSYYGTGFLRFEIWGVPDGRTVSLSAPVTSNHRTAVETTVVNKSLAPGTSKRVEYPHNGFDAVVTRTVRDADGGVIWSNTWTSHYRTVNGITEVGPKPAATPTPKPTPTPSPSPG